MKPEVTIRDETNADIDAITSVTVAARPRDKIRMKRRNQGCQFFHELQRTKYHDCRAIIPQPLQPVRQSTVRQNGRSVLGYGRSGHVPAQTFQRDSVMAINTGPCMKCEPLELRTAPA